MSVFGMQACSSPTKQETHLVSMDQLSATSFPPVTQPACSQFATSQSSSPQRRVVILPMRGSVSPVKVATSPKRVFSSQVFTSSGGSPQPVCAAYTNCSLVGSKHVAAVRNASLSDSASICTSGSPCVSSISHVINSESDDRALSARLHVDGILTSSSENASRHGIVSVACRESRVQETSVLSRVTFVSRLPAPASADNHSVPDSNAAPGSMHQTGSCVSQMTTDKVSSTQVKLGEASVHHAVTLTRAVPQTARSVNVTSVRKICPSTDAQKRSVVVKLFPECSSSCDVQMAEQCSPANVTSPSSAVSPKRVPVVLLTATTVESTSTSGSCSRSAGYVTSVKVTATCQSCSPFRSVNLAVTSAAKAASVMSSSICHIAASCPVQKVTESVVLPSDGIQVDAVAAVGCSVSNTRAIQAPAKNLSNGGTRSEDDSDDDSVVIIDADIQLPSLPSPSRNGKKRSSATQNVILLNHHKSSSHHAVDSRHSSSNAVVTDRIEQSRTKRKPVLSTRLLESASDEGVILPVAHGFEYGSRSSQPSRRKSFPQRRTDTSGPQLQFCTKQWKRDMNYSRSTNASPTCKHLQSGSPKKDTSGELLHSVDCSNKSEILLSESNLQSCQNICDRRKRKSVEHCESSAFQEVKRSKRSSPAKSSNTYCNKNMAFADSEVHKATTVDLGKVSTLFPSESVITVSSCSTTVSTDATKTSSGEMKTAEQDVDLSSELQVLGKDKRSMEMSVTNEEGVVENLLVTIIDISSSEEEENDDTVEIHSLSSTKLDSSEVPVPETKTSQSAAPKSVSSSVGSSEKTVKACVKLRRLSPDHKPISKSSCKTKPVRRKCQETVQQSSMGRKVLVSQGRASLNDGVDVAKVKQLTQLHRKANGHKHSKADDAAGAVKQIKVESDSAAARSLGPIVRLRGSKHHPVSCCVVSGARDVQDETAAKLKHKPVQLSSSCYPTSFQLQDSVSWRCIFCHQGSSHRTLGDLFGPYYAKTDDSVKSDGVKCQSSPSKSRSHSAKKSPKSGYVLVSQRGRQRLQKYAPAVTMTSRRKSQTSPDKGIPPEIWLHEDCAIWTNGICLSSTGQLCGLEAAITLSLQTVYLLYNVIQNDEHFNVPVPSQ